MSTTKTHFVMLYVFVRLIFIIKVCCKLAFFRFLITLGQNVVEDVDKSSVDITVAGDCKLTSQGTTEHSLGKYKYIMFVLASATYLSPT